MHPSSHQRFTREQWLRAWSASRLQPAESDVNAFPSANDLIPTTEIDEVFRPLACVIASFLQCSERPKYLRIAGHDARPVSSPFMIAVTGGVAVGKSTIGRVLRALLPLCSDRADVSLVSTDGFLFPRDQLVASGLLDRKGFPESYDGKRLMRFLTDVREGKRASAPVYSHNRYDRVLGEEIVVDRPDILIIEGLNVLSFGSAINGHPAEETALFDLSIYVDAAERDVERWYLDRFRALRRNAVGNPDSYFHGIASLSDDRAEAFARVRWATINRPNLRANIVPTRPSADILIHKKRDHSVDHLWLRRSIL